MASSVAPYLTTRRWRRTEYDRLVDLGVFEGERLELLDGVLVVKEPQGSPHAVAIVTGAPRDYLGAHPSTADLVVEVADSSLRLDRRLKAGLYARARLPEYQSVDVLRPPAVVTPLAAPAVRIPVAELLP
jgi:Uma2 family endonuclease